MSEVLVLAPLVLDDITTPRGAVTAELGGAAYAALAARHFAPTAIAALVGDDFPRSHLDRLAGIDLGLVRRVAGASFRWAGEHRADGTTATLRNDAGATRGRLPTLGDLRDAYVLVGALEPSLQERVGPARLLAIDTMPCYIDEDAPRLRRAFAGADVAFLTVDEAERLAGSRHADEVRRVLGARIVVLKAGPRGATVCDEDASLHVPAYRVEVVDPTGAGDAFAGAFVATLAARGSSDAETLRLAARRGAAAASVAVEDFGPRALERVSREEIERRAEVLLREEART